MSVVVTGMGAVSALGVGTEQNYRATIEGRCGVARHVFSAGELGPEPKEFLAALVAEGFDNTLSDHNISQLDRVSKFALVAAREALEQAHLLDDHATLEDAGVVLGHSQGGMASMESTYERFFGRRTDRVHPLTLPRLMVSAPVSAVSMHFGLRGPAFAVSSACASSAHAIAQGAGLIESGQVEVVVVGGCDTITTFSSMVGWDALHAASNTGCRPFSKDRDGMVVGEGGACFVLESRAHAEDRNAAILAYYIGCGMSADGWHITQPAEKGMHKAISKANQRLSDAGEILISTHGTGTLLNDKAEAEALYMAYGPKPRHPVIATKANHGHLVGGAAALQAVVAVSALINGMAPPIVGVTESACDLNLVLREAQPITAKHTLINAFAFGGLNCSIVFGID